VEVDPEPIGGLIAWLGVMEELAAGMHNRRTIDKSARTWEWRPWTSGLPDLSWSWPRNLSRRLKWRNRRARIAWQLDQVLDEEGPLMIRVALFLLVTLITISCAPRDDSVEARNGELVRVVFSEIWSKGNVDLIPNLFSENFVGHFPGGATVHGREGLAAEVMAHRTAFPDWAEQVEDLIMDHDRVAVRFASRGTNTGNFLGNPPTGKRVEISEVAIFRLENGKLAEQWVYPDMLSLQRQLKPEQRP